MKAWFEAEPARRMLRRLAAERDLTVGELAALLRLDRRTVSRIFGRDRLRADTADRIAVASGRHPSELWPDYYRTDDIPPAHRRTNTTRACRLPTDSRRRRPVPTGSRPLTSAAIRLRSDAGEPPRPRPRPRGGSR
jgi:plasmid maintenance system antidote protein VapI